jgi:hypothetical protein
MVSKPGEKTKKGYHSGENRKTGGGRTMSAEEKQNKDQDQKPLDKMTVKELREVAADIEEITGASGMKKADLLAAIKKVKGIEDEAPPKKKTVKTKGAAGPKTISEIKARIAELREEREALRQAGDRVKVKIIRRRINRLKKKTRRVPAAGPPQ